MATIVKRKGRGGVVRYLAQARVYGFKPFAKTFDTRAEAKAWGQQKETELRSQRGRANVRPNVGQLTIANLVREYLQDDHTLAMRGLPVAKLRLEWWVNRYGSVRLLEFGVTVLRAARMELRQQDRGPATANRYLSEMRSCWNWAIAAGMVPDGYAWPKRLMFAEPKGRTRYLSDREIGDLLKAAEHDPVVYGAIVVSIATGLRQGELLRLQWADLDLNGERVAAKTPCLLVREAKNDTPRAVYLPSKAVDALRRLRAGKRVSLTHVFTNHDGQPLRKGILEFRWRRIRKAAKLRDFRWHDLRHTCASHLLQAGATLEQVADVLGHHSLAMTRRYAHLVQGAPITGHDVLDSKLTPRAD